MVSMRPAQRRLRATGTTLPSGWEDLDGWNRSSREEAPRAQCGKVDESWAWRAVCGVKERSPSTVDQKRSRRSRKGQGLLVGRPTVHCQLSRVQWSGARPLAELPRID